MVAETLKAPEASEASFFDVSSATELYVSPGGMRNLCEGLARRGAFRTARGTRVRSARREGQHWVLRGEAGAHHEAPEGAVEGLEDQPLGSFEALILTDAARWGGKSLAELAR